MTVTFSSTAEIIKSVEVYVLKLQASPLDVFFKGRDSPLSATSVQGLTVLACKLFGLYPSTNNFFNAKPSSDLVPSFVTRKINRV